MKNLFVSTLLLTGLLAACDQKDLTGEGPMERAGKAVDRTTHAAIRETGNAVLHSKVRVALLEALGADALRMQIDVDDGNVSLSGRVREPGSRERAAAVAGEVGGVQSVKADIGLIADGSGDVPPADKLGKELADRTLEAKVQLRLFGEFDAQVLRVTVAALNGAVTLSGDMDNKDLRARAEETVRTTEGVSQVINHIAIKSR
jgi:osmotically-inducible protein OsmY